MRLESRNIKGTRDASHDMIFAGIITKGLFEKKNINFLCGSRQSVETIKIRARHWMER